MELIPVIYNILPYVLALLGFVIIFSFVINRTKEKNVDEPSSQANDAVTSKTQNVWKNDSYQEEQKLGRAELSHEPKIYQINNFIQQKRKIITQPTLHSRETQESSRRIEKRSNNFDVNRKRYVIVNDEMKKTESKVINFY